MKTFINQAILLVALSVVPAMMPARVQADEWPLVLGDMWEVSGITLKDGGELAYATFLAGEWKASQEFAKSKGWVKGYKVLNNVYWRKGEPHLYLITIIDSVVSGAEFEKRDQEYRAWRKATIAQLTKESGDRAEFREVSSNSLLQEMTFR